MLYILLLLCIVVLLAILRNLEEINKKNKDR